MSAITTTSAPLCLLRAFSWSSESGGPRGVRSASSRRVSSKGTTTRPLWRAKCSVRKRCALIWISPFSSARRTGSTSGGGASSNEWICVLLLIGASRSTGPTTTLRGMVAEEDECPHTVLQPQRIPHRLITATNSNTREAVDRSVRFQATALSSRKTVSAKAISRRGNFDCAVLGRTERVSGQQSRLVAENSNALCLTD